MTGKRFYVNVELVGGPHSGEVHPQLWPPQVCVRAGDLESGLYHLTTDYSQLYDVAVVEPWWSEGQIREALHGKSPLRYHWAPVVRTPDQAGMTMFTGTITQDEMLRLIAERPT